MLCKQSSGHDLIDEAAHLFVYSHALLLLVLCALCAIL